MARRKRPTIKLRKRGLILCEGETEVKYFKGLVNHESNRNRLGATTVIRKPKDNSPNGIVDEAKREIAKAKKEGVPYEFVCLVFDRDGHANIGNAFEKVRQADSGIRIGFTVVCFEFFVLLHFKKTMKGCANCDAVIKEVRKEMPDYEKASDSYKTLLPFKESGLANSEWSMAQNKTDIQNGKKLHELTAYCDVHKIVEFLENLQ
jgi:hypothetical protein